MPGDRLQNSIDQGLPPGAVAPATEDELERARVETLSAIMRQEKLAPYSPIESIQRFFAVTQSERAELQSEVIVLLCKFEEMAERIIDALPISIERTESLRKLLEARDAALRAAR